MKATEVACPKCGNVEDFYDEALCSMDPETGKCHCIVEVKCFCCDHGYEVTVCVEMECDVHESVKKRKRAKPKKG